MAVPKDSAGHTCLSLIGMQFLHQKQMRGENSRHASAYLLKLLRRTTGSGDFAKPLPPTPSVVAPAAYPRLLPLFSALPAKAFRFSLRPSPNDSAGRAASATQTRSSRECRYVLSGTNAHCRALVPAGPPYTKSRFRISTENRWSHTRTANPLRA